MNLLKMRKPEKSIRDLIRTVMPFFLIVFVIPLVQWPIRLYHNEEIQQVLLKTLWYDDHYHLIKTIFLYAAICVLFVVFICRGEREVRFPGAFFLMVPYLVLLILSTYFSDYKISAFFGILDHYEGCLTQLCYCLILLFSYYLMPEADQMVCIFKVMFSASMIVACIGLVQMAGQNADEISSTIGNANYVGTYAAVIIPVAFAMVLYEPGFLRKGCAILFALGPSLILLFGSMSRAAYLSALTTLVLFSLFLGKEIVRQYQWMLASLLFVGMVFILMNALSQGALVDEWKNLNPFSQEVKTDTLYFEDVKQENMSVVIETNQWTLKIKNNGDGFVFFTGAGDALPYIEKNEGKQIRFPSQPYEGIRGYWQKNKEFQWLMLNMRGKEIEFVSTDGKIQVVGYNGRITDIEAAASFGFKGWESFASGRAYIWSRAIPLLRKAIFLGYGPDTFTYIFPQNDIAGKLNYGAIWVIIGKPHNWYLQIALGSGILSLVFLLSLILWLVIKVGISLHQLNADAPWDESQRRKRILLCGLLLSVVGYGITGIFNDSVVAVSPIFWMLLGFAGKTREN